MIVTMHCPNPANKSTRCSTTRDAAAQQLENYAKEHKDNPCTATHTVGNPTRYLNSMETAGPKGLALLQDVNFLDELSHFDRERIPERVVHAKGAAAFGYLEITHDITEYTAAKPFQTIGKKTPVAMRFSQVAGEMGSADTVRDPRGFATKLYTEDGIWDIVGNNTPIFFIRDAILFPSFIHSQKRNPVTHLRDYDAYWDFISLRPESTHQVMYMFSDRGIPNGHRHMHGFGSNTYSMINAAGVLKYVKFHFRTEQGVENLDPDNAEIIAGKDPDYAVRDLYNNIATGNFPSWKFEIQVMTEEQAATYQFDPFDVTKVWYHKDFPLIPVGRICLNRNPSNNFAEVEQLGFSPSNFIPGIGPSPDRMLQGRLFAYTDTQRYRLGVNSAQIPVNAPFKVCSYARDGAHTIDNQNGSPNFHPNSFDGPKASKRALDLTPRFKIDGTSGYYDSRDEDNFTQPQIFYRRILDEGGRTRLINNLANHIKNANETIQARCVQLFSQVDETFGRRLAVGLQTSRLRATL